VAEWAEGNGHPPRLPSRGTGRRRSAVTLLVLLVALPVSFLVAMVTGGDWRRVASARALEDRAVIYLRNLRVFVVQTEDGPLALSALSPHRGDRVLFCPFADAFQEAHGALFDRRGFFLAGPAARGLDRVAVRIRDGFVEVDPSRTAPGPPRAGAAEDVSDPVPGPGARGPAGLRRGATGSRRMKASR
jgi:nitrite reductase/ring-hydroxylating ferredoxin subunit